jgi:hypothetical protein
LSGILFAVDESVALILAVFVNVALTRAQETPPCSEFSIEAVEKADPGTPVVFTARPNTSNVSLVGLRFNWSVSVGTIMVGQDTSSITVDTTGLGGQAVTTSVGIVGNQMHCSTSKIVEINAPPPPECPFDSYRDIRFSWEKARLDNFAIQIQNYPGSRGAIFTYAGKQTYKGEAFDRLQRAKNYLVKVRGLNPESILTIDAGHNTEVSTILFVVPPGATVPTFESRIPLAQVRFTRRSASRRTKH